MALHVNVLEINSWAGFTGAGVEALRSLEMVESVHCDDACADGRYRQLTIVARSAEDILLLKVAIQTLDVSAAVN